MDVVAETESARESLKALYDPDTSVKVNRETFLFYKFKQGNNMIHNVVLNDIPYQIFSFRSDFEPLNLTTSKTGSIEYLHKHVHIPLEHSSPQRRMRLFQMLLPSTKP
jgi:hypothetical protein